MLSALARWLFGRAGAQFSSLEVVAAATLQEPSGNDMAVRVLFTTDPRFNGDLIFLGRLTGQILGSLWGQSALDSAREAMVQEAFLRNFPGQAGGVRPLPADFVAQVPLFVADLIIPLKLLMSGYDAMDLNAGLLRVAFDGQTAELLGMVGADEAARRRLAQLRQRGGQYLEAELVQANANLYLPRRAGGDACLVLFTFDASVSRRTILTLANRIYELKTSTMSDPDLLTAATAARASEAGWRYHRRFRLPGALTGGAEIYAADLWIHRPFLAEGRLRSREEVGEQSRSLPCFAEPGAGGGIELMPFEEAAAHAPR